MSQNSDIIFGKNSVESLISADKRNINKIFVSSILKQDSKLKRIKKLAAEKGITVQEVPKEKLDKLSENAVHQGIVASVSPIEYMDFDKFLKNLSSEKNSLVVMLDSVEDPHNLGSIIRTACAAGADGIIIAKRRASQVTGIVDKTSAGALSILPIIQVGNLNKAIEKMKERNFWVFGAEADANKYYFQENFKNINCLLVLGGEDKGVSKLVRKNCDGLLKIPMNENMNSLNVSNAASVLIYEVVRQRMIDK